MAKRGKRYRQLAESYDRQALHPVQDAIELVKKLATAKFDESVDVAIVLGIDPRKSDQRVRGVVQLPYGTGKKPIVAVIAKGEKAKEAEEAGADYVGAEDLVDRIEKGFKDFDYLIATPDMMRLVSRLGRKLGPLMPSPRTGTVTSEVGEVVRQIKTVGWTFGPTHKGSSMPSSVKSLSRRSNCWKTFGRFWMPC